MNDRSSTHEERDDEPIALAAEFATREAKSVDIQPVSDSTSRLSFGVQALLGLIVVIAVQFAVMSYLGPVVGLIVGVVLCVLGIGAFMWMIIMGVRRRGAIREQMDRVAFRVVVGIVILFVGTIVAGGGRMMYVVLEDTWFHWRMERDFGFSYEERTFVEYNKDWRLQFLFEPATRTETKALEVTSVTPGGPIDQAGVRKGDLIMIDVPSAKAFLKRLDEQRGQSIDINVVSFDDTGGFGPPYTDINSGTRRVETLHVPQ